GVIPVLQSSPTRRSSDLAYATVDGTAAAPGDYTAKSGSLTFSPGQTFKTVPVTVRGDVVDEADEAFSLNLSNPSEPIIADGTGSATIVDDDPAPVLAVGAVVVAEGNGGTSTAVFTVRLTAAAAHAGTVDYGTAD